MFLPTTEDSIDEFLALPSRLEYRWRSRWSGILPDGLAAARIQGDSMNDLGIFHGKIIIFRYSNSLENGEILLIERLGDEEGTGAWCLKKVIFVHPSSKRNEFGDDIGSDSPIFTLRSYNPKFSAQNLGPSGRYRVRGIFLNTVADEDVSLIDTERLRAITEEE